MLKKRHNKSNNAKSDVKSIDRTKDTKGKSKSTFNYLFRAAPKQDESKWLDLDTIDDDAKQDFGGDKPIPISDVSVPNKGNDDIDFLDLNLVEQNIEAHKYIFWAKLKSKFNRLHFLEKFIAEFSVFSVSSQDDPKNSSQYEGEAPEFKIKIQKEQEMVSVARDIINNMNSAYYCLQEFKLIVDNKNDNKICNKLYKVAMSVLYVYCQTYLSSSTDDSYSKNNLSGDNTKNALLDVLNSCSDDAAYNSSSISASIPNHIKAVLKEIKDKHFKRTLGFDCRQFIKASKGLGWKDFRCDIILKSQELSIGLLGNYFEIEFCDYKGKSIRRVILDVSDKISYSEISGALFGVPNVFLSESIIPDDGKIIIIEESSNLSSENIYSALQKLASIFSEHESFSNQKPKSRLKPILEPIIEESKEFSSLSELLEKSCEHDASYG